MNAVADRLAGGWVLVGGALVSLWLDSRRTTEDVDLFGIDGGQTARFELMKLAQDLGLSVESVNSAADFFVQRIPGWEKELEPLRAGAKGTVYRPTPTLFLMLKAARLSSTDLDDCRAMIAKSRADHLPIDVPRILGWIGELPTMSDQALTERRERLVELLDK
ncbi:nucleotidyl transferase AbiEii/AbiGii toxin family protein [Vulgatibacter incomptus]|uniref:Nucleotidyl transferase AbiEii/AbiGii toxin family protein n=1 Tax=Vulgatibacter incomptus TaxID=1391653 RepID=A0A0K1PBL4_9BACT|nr:nucleotidyl transferase AbiEii/AbiGii toxin family protein [Vulgatibacter incomptus]AKU90915.1 hypothetical protein AKJ08_1302 [Vulgatibacter incomptus]